jgi:alcohol dehydrogenase
MFNLYILNSETKGVFMKAVMYENFSETPKLVTLPDPIPENDSAVIKVKATGL